MKIIAFGYRRKSGKDTLATFIQRELRLKHRNLNVRVAGFADQLKDICFALYGWLGLKSRQHYEQFPEDKEKQLDGLPYGCKSARDLWIAFGNYNRQFDPGIWRNALLKTTTCDILIIKDLRFPEEMDAVQDQYGKVCRVDRPGTEDADGQPDTVLMNVSNEKWDHIYNNNGTLRDLHQLALSIAGELI